MANKRNFKKAINSITDELLTECLFCGLDSPNVDENKVGETVSKIFAMQEEFIKRANNTDGKDNPAVVRKYYAKLKTDLLKTVNDIEEEMNSFSQPTVVK